MKIKILVIIFAVGIMNNLSFCQPNLIPNGNFEGHQTGFSQCSFSSVNNWKIAQHNIDLGPNTPNYINQPDGCSLLGDNSNCSSFPANTIPKRFVHISALYTKCNEFGHKPIKLFHDAIGVSLENGSTFDQGVKYIIRYKIIPVRSQNNDNQGGLGGLLDNGGGLFCIWDGNQALRSHIRFFLSEEGPATWNNNSSDRQELNSVNFDETLTPLASPNQAFTNCAWKQVQREFIPLQNNFTAFIIFMERGGAYIDDVEIFRECENYYSIQNKEYDLTFAGPGAVGGFNLSEKAGIDLNAGKNIDNSKPQGDVKLDNGSKVNFTASHEIRLFDGFNAFTGSEFAAVILPCPNNLNRGTTDWTNMNPDPNYVVPEPLLSNQEYEKKFNDDKVNNFIEAKIFPNPNSGKFELLLDNGLEYPKQIVIRDIMGRNVKVIDNASSYDYEFDLEKESKGIYMISIYYSDRVTSKRIVKN